MMISDIVRYLSVGADDRTPTRFVFEAYGAVCVLQSRYAYAYAYRALQLVLVLAIVVQTG